MNAIDADIADIMEKGLARLDSDFDGLVIGNQGEHFTVGMNLGLALMTIAQGAVDQIEAFVKRGQDLAMAIRYAKKPIVAAPFNLTLGGGTEFSMAAWRMVAHAETYMGLVEMGVGIIPAWGGCKEMIRRNINPVMEASPDASVLPHLEKIFTIIGTAKVAVSAMEAREMGFLSPSDRIVMNRDHQLAEAKREVLTLIASGASNGSAGKVYAAGRDALALLNMGAWTMHQGNYATEFEEFLGKKLAYVLTGGDLSGPQWVPEQYILDLERTTIVELLQHPKTMERMQHTLETGKPLRN
jgi:3-hydroxyacyl-CoA dehydrogenase